MEERELLRAGGESTFDILEGSLSFDRHGVAASLPHDRRKMAHHNENPGHEHGSAGYHVQSRTTSVEHGVDRVGP